MVLNRFSGFLLFYIPILNEPEASSEFAQQRIQIYEGFRTTKGHFLILFEKGNRAARIDTIDKNQ